MVMKMGLHRNVKVEVRKCKQGGWLLVQRNPVHGWNDQIEKHDTLKDAEARAAWWNEWIDLLG